MAISISREGVFKNESMRNPPSIKSSDGDASKNLAKIPKISRSLVLSNN